MRPHNTLLSACLLVAVITPASAQYKWVGPTGGITYSDLPPPSGVQAQPLMVPGRAVIGQQEPDLPAGLRTISLRYPVVLYTTRDCSPCQQGRGHLVGRGIPFSEKTVLTEDDAQAFKRLGFGQVGFPALSIGREKRTGFDADAWGRLLDAAGYPKVGTLPPGYRLAPAQSLARPPGKPTESSEDGQALSGNAANDTGPDAAADLLTVKRVNPRSTATQAPAQPATPGLRF